MFPKEGRHILDDAVDVGEHCPRPQWDPSRRWPRRSGGDNRPGGAFPDGESTLPRLLRLSVYPLQSRFQRRRPAVAMLRESPWERRISARAQAPTGVALSASASRVRRSTSFPSVLEVLLRTMRVPSPFFREGMGNQLSSLLLRATLSDGLPENSCSKESLRKVGRIGKTIFSRTCGCLFPRIAVPNRGRGAHTDPRGEP